MDNSKHPSQMEQQRSYKRTYPAPAATLDSDIFSVLWKKQRLAEVRQAIIRGDWPSPITNDESGSDTDSTSASTSCTNSPRRSGHGRHSGEHRRHHHHHDEESDEDPDFEEALQEAADAQLQVVLAGIKEQHEEQLQASRAAVQEVEEQHTATTKQMADIQSKLDALKSEKHELFQQLKLANQAAAREAAAAAAAAQHAAFQQQQRQWQQQQQQMPPPPPNMQQGHTPFHAATYAGQPFPGAPPGLHPHQPQSQPTTPRVGMLQTSSSGLMSPAAHATWAGSSPQFGQPPPPPPPRHADGAGSSGGGGTPAYHHQQQQHGPQRTQSLVPPAFHQTQSPQQHFGQQRHGNWTPGGSNQPQQQQHQQQQQPLGRANSDTQYWAAGAERGSHHRLDRLGSDRLERLSASGHEGGDHAAALEGPQPGRDGSEHHWQQPKHQQQQQQAWGGMGSPYGRGARHEGGGRGARSLAVGERHAPDSPEEGEALPSPPGPAIRKQLAAAAAAAARTAAAGEAATGSDSIAGAGPGAGPAAVPGAGQPVEPSSAGRPPPRAGLERGPSGSMHGGHTGAGAGSSGGAGYRAPAAGYAEALEDVDGTRAGRQGASLGMALTGLRRSSSGGSTSGLHGLTSPTGMQRLPRESPRGWPAAPVDATHAGRRGPSATGSGASLFRSASAAYYPSPPVESGPAGGVSGGAGAARGREEGGVLPTPWQVDGRRSSADGWGHGQDGGGGEGQPSGPGAGKPWGRQAGRGRGIGGYHRT